MAEWVPEVAYADADVAIGHAGPVLALFWRAEITVAALERLQAVTAERAAHAPLLLFRIVEPGASVPERGARELGATFLESTGELVGVSAFVVEGTPMQAAAFRGVDAGLAVLAKRDYPHGVFPSLRAAVAWVGKRSRFSAKSLQAALDEIRRLSR
jgi:hypothetical protein